MQRLIEKLSLVITLLTILLFSNVASVTDSGFSQGHFSVASQEQTQDASSETLILRYGVPRLSSLDIQPPNNGPSPWPLVIATVASLISLFLFVAYIARSYLSFNNHRLAGWQETNLQYCFIHSR